jgi:response regulator of citrate/malate metabolism
MEQRIAELEMKVTQITDTFVKFMNIPYKNQKEVIARLMPLLDMYEKKEGPFVEKKKHTRRPLNKADWSRIQACLNDEGGAASWSEVAKASGVPASTARKYAKMTPDEVAALPDGIIFEVEEDGEE